MEKIQGNLFEQLNKELQMVECMEGVNRFYDAGYVNPIFEISYFANSFSLKFNPDRDPAIFVNIISSISSHPERIALWRKQENHIKIGDIIANLIVGIFPENMGYKDIHNKNSTASFKTLEYPLENSEPGIIYHYTIEGESIDLLKPQKEEVADSVVKARQVLELKNVQDINYLFKFKKMVVATRRHSYERQKATYSNYWAVILSDSKLRIRQHYPTKF